MSSAEFGRDVYVVGIGMHPFGNDGVAVDDMAFWAGRGVAVVRVGA